MQAEAAETLALKGLSFLAGEGGALARFLNLSGLEIADLRSQANQPDLLAAVLDFILGDDALIAAFCASEAMIPADLHAARRALPGASEI